MPAAGPGPSRRRRRRTPRAGGRLAGGRASDVSTYGRRKKLRRPLAQGLHVHFDPMPHRLLVVSNRLPIVLEKKDDGWALKPGSGGLVSALAPVLSHRGGLWVGWPGLPLERDGS